MQFSSVWLLDRTLSGVTTPGQRGLGNDGNEGVRNIPQSSSIIGTSPSDCLVLYPGHSLVGVLLLCREAVGVFYSPSELDNIAIRRKENSSESLIRENPHEDQNL